MSPKRTVPSLTRGRQKEQLRLASVLRSSHTSDQSCVPPDPSTGCTGMDSGDGSLGSNASSSV